MYGLLQFFSLFLTVPFRNQLSHVLRWNSSLVHLGNWNGKVISDNPTFIKQPQYVCSARKSHRECHEPSGCIIDEVSAAAAEAGALDRHRPSPNFREW